jgi:phenylalanyl-tRNA synthetase beta chain
MKIAYNWLQKYIKLNLTPEETAEKLTSVGLEVENTYEYSTVPSLPGGLVIGEVSSVMPHPNAEKLKLTQVNIGGPEPLHIVCGAPNVAEGQKVVIATIGTELQPTKGEGFKISKSKIRGEVSEGMLCAEDEIGLGESHAGIMVLSADAPVGTSFKDYISGYRDHVIEIGLTPNRVDAASHIGVARDLSALLDTDLEYPLLTADFKNTETVPPIKIQVETPDECIRYSGVVINGIKVGSSPDWLKNHLQSIGLKPINNIVDITNFVMYECGQPLHAFDLSKISGEEIIIRTAREGEKITTLDKSERSLKGFELLICNADVPMALAGVMGGIESGINEYTTSIFLESACFEPSVVRKAARQHGLFTDASFRFERGTDPDATVDALRRAVDIILEVEGGRVVDHLYDIYPNPLDLKKIEFSLSYLNRLAGNEIEKTETKKILTRLGIKILKEEEDTLLLEIPGFKRDVTRIVDVAEEALRIYSYDRITFGQQLKSVIQADPNYAQETIKRKISGYLVANGFYEAYNLSFVSTNQHEKPEEILPVAVLNPLSIETAELRNNMLIQGLKMLEHNLNRQQGENRFFEWGTIHQKKQEGYSEKQILSIWVTGHTGVTNWNNNPGKADIYYIKGIVESLLTQAGLALNFETIEDDIFETGGKYVQNNKLMARLGIVSDALLKRAGIETAVLYAEIDARILFKEQKTPEHKPYSRFPRVVRDLALVVPDEVKYHDIKNVIRQTEKHLLKSVNLFDVYKGAQVQEGHKSYAIRLEFENYGQTLEDKAVDKMISRISGALEQRLKVKIR